MNIHSCYSVVARMLTYIDEHLCMAINKTLKICSYYVPIVIDLDALQCSYVYLL